MMVRTTLLAAAVLALLASGPRISHAQSGSDLVLTWHTTAYAPSDFTGKIFPTTNSYLVASALVLRNGKAVDLSNHEVRWYVDDELVRSGPGLDSAAFRAPSVTGAIEVRAEVPDLEVLKTVDIPVVSPKAVIRSSYDGRFSVTNPVFRARPFFFNVVSFKDLVIQWRANGNPPADDSDPGSLEVNILPGTPENFALNLELVVKNPNSFFEVGKGMLTLIYSPR